MDNALTADDHQDKPTTPYLTTGDFKQLFRSLLAKGIAALEWEEFEKLAGAMFNLEGYKVEFTPSTGDEGIDLKLYKRGVLHVVQCKHWKDEIGSPVVRDFYGAMTHSGARKGYLLATGGISKSAIAFAEGKPIELVGLDKLITWLWRSLNLIENNWEHYRDPKSRIILP